MADIVDQILSDPNTTFRAEDAESLRKLDKGTLKRMMIGMQSQATSDPADMSGSDDDSEEMNRIEELQKELSGYQQDLQTLIIAERDVRNELDSYGVKTNSILDRFVAVTNQRAPSRPEDLSEQEVLEYVHKAKTPLAVYLREGLSARKTNRAKSIDVIVKNSRIYSQAELERMFTPDLEKLASFVLATKQSQPEVPDYDWVGSGMADQSVNQNSLGRMGGTLDLPSQGSTAPIY